VAVSAPVAASAIATVDTVVVHARVAQPGVKPVIQGRTSRKNEVQMLRRFVSIDEKRSPNVGPSE